MKNIIVILTFTLLLSACGSKRTEMPVNNSGGSDYMRLSPCACQQIEDYNGSGFEWRG